MTGPRAITEFSGFLHGKLYPGFSFEDVNIHIQTAEQVFPEYHINHSWASRAKTSNSNSSGHLEAADGKIKRLREAIDVVVAAEAIIWIGLLDVINKETLKSPQSSGGAWPPSPSQPLPLSPDELLRPASFYCFCKSFCRNRILLIGRATLFAPLSGRQPGRWRWFWGC